MAREFSPGFRLSAVDVFVLILGMIGVSVLVRTEPALALIVGFVVGHFFLFCNIVRMARPLELCWAVCFIVLAGSTLTTGMPSWPVTMFASLVVTAIVVTLEMRKQSYHGVFWQRINPHLRTWWELHQSSRGHESSGVFAPRKKITNDCNSASARYDASLTEVLSGVWPGRE